jgi:hypothetical protein
MTERVPKMQSESTAACGGINRNAAASEPKRDDRSEAWVLECTIPNERATGVRECHEKGAQPLDERVPMNMSES